MDTKKPSLIENLTYIQDEMNKLFEEVINSSGRERGKMKSPSWEPSIDIYETEDSVKIKAELPGIEKDDIDLEVENYVLTISGKRKHPESQDGEHFHRIERAYGTFDRSFSLPRSLDTENIQAQQRNGVLVISIPRQKESSGDKIDVEVKSKE